MEIGDWESGRVGEWRVESGEWRLGDWRLRGGGGEGAEEGEEGEPDEKGDWAVVAEDAGES